MSLETELRTEQVAHLDLSAFSLVASGTPVRVVLAQIRADANNACLIVDGDKLVGIFTDRDVLRKVIGAPDTLDRPIDDVMTHNPITIAPDSSAADALRLMDDNHFRNLPAVDANGKVIGNMTHQSIVHYLAARFPIEVINRPPELDRFPRRQEGG